MRTANPELENMIKTQCLILLMEKEPEEIRMQDIARACGVSATTIYYYYRDKESLFETVKLDCLEKMAQYILDRVVNMQSIEAQLREGLIAFRDWAFSNPRIALLVMTRFKPNLTASVEKMSRYYRANDFAKDLLDQAVSEGIVEIKDTKLETALIIAGLWGAIEAVLLKRTYPEYWEQGISFTNRMIDLLCPIHSENK